MYQYRKQQKRWNNRQSPQKMKVSEPLTKAYSFTDPLFQSFGNCNPQGVKNVQRKQKKCQNFRMERFEINQSKIQSQLFSQLEQVSDRTNLMSRMLKINKPITNPSVLIVNSQNKMKTKMLIESKRLNNDENSIILCENANKYLNFIEVLNQLQNYHQIETNFQENYANRQTLLGSRIEQNYLSKKRLADKQIYYDEPLKASDINNKNQSSKEKTIPIQGNSNQFFSHDNSAHLNSNPKTTHFSSGLSTVQRMFQGIKTPQTIQNQQQFIFTPLRQQNKYQSQFVNLETQGRKIKNVKSPLSSAVLQVKNATKKPFEQEIHTFNKKTQTIHSKSPFMNKKTQQVSISRSKSKNDITTKASAKQQYKVSQKDSKSSKRNKSLTNFQSMRDSKNLVYKTLDKTSQFDKMLKMASSRINPC